MAFRIEIVADPAPVVRAAGRVEDSLASTQSTADRVREAIGMAFNDLERSLDRVSRKAKTTSNNLRQLIASQQPAPRAPDWTSFTAGLNQVRATSARSEVESLIGAANAPSALAQMRGVTAATQEATKATSAFNGALKAVAWAAVAKGAYDLADAYGNIQNRLKVVTNSSEELAEMNDKLFEVSQRTRSSYQATVELYSRVALSTRQLGISTQEVTQFVESLNKTVILSGASAQEAYNGITQLSQGLASGALRGDELRAVLEQLPMVADVIAKSLGVTRGKLREMGAEGKLTSEMILKAFRESREEIDERFSKTVPTAGQVIQQLKNTVTRFLGEAANALVPVLQTVASTIAKVLETAGPLLTAVGKLAAAITKLTLTPIIAWLNAILKAMGPVIKAVTALADAVSWVIDSLMDLVTAQDTYLISSEELEKAGINVQGTMRGMWEQAERVSKEMEDQSLTIAIYAAQVERAKKVQEGYNYALGQLGQLQVRRIEELDKLVRETGRLAKVTKEMRDELFPLEKAWREMIDAEEAMGRAVQLGFLTQEESVEVLRRKREAMADQLDPLGAIQSKLREEITLLNLSSKQRAVASAMIELENEARQKGIILTDAELVQLRALVEAREKAAERAKVRDSSGNRLEQFRNQLRALVGSMLPVEAAHAELTDARQLLTEAVRRG